MRVIENKHGLLLIMVSESYLGFSLTLEINVPKASSDRNRGVGLELLIGLVIIVATFDIPPGLSAVLRTWSDKIVI